MRGVDRRVPAAQQFDLDEPFEQPADGRPLGHPQDEPLAGLRADGEQLELLAEHPVVALLGLFELGQVGVKLLLGEEGGGVEPLELLAAGVVLPVRPGDAQELERPDLAGVRDVRPAAQVDELALPVEAKVGVPAQHLVDVLDLEFLLQVGAQGPGLGGRALEPLERLGGGDGLLHLRLDPREVGLGDRGRRIDVVVEPVGQGRAEGELGAGEQAHDRPGHDVGGAVPQDLERLGVAVGEDLERRLRRVGGQFAVEVHDLAVHLGGDGGLSQPLADRLGHVARPGARRDLAGRAVGEFQGNHRGERSRSPAGRYAPTTGVPRAGHVESDGGSWYGGTGGLAFPGPAPFAIPPPL